MISQYWISNKLYQIHENRALNFMSPQGSLQFFRWTIHMNTWYDNVSSVKFSNEVGKDIVQLQRPKLVLLLTKGVLPLLKYFWEVIMEVWSGAISPSWVQHNGLTHYARRMFTWEAPKYLLIAGRHPLYIGGSSWTGIKGPT